MSALTGKAVPGTASADPGVELRRFYGAQVRLLDGGRSVEWAATLAENTSLKLLNRPEPVPGRAAIAAAPQAGAAALAAEGQLRRHVIAMTEAEPRPEDAFGVRAYVVVHSPRDDGTSRAAQVHLCEDVLVRRGGALCVRRRRITPESGS
ncbi:nuclear transport factor 2 family protein [Streptomyces phaeochromogenes]